MKDFAQLLFDRHFDDWKDMPVEKIKSLIKVKAQKILPM